MIHRVPRCRLSWFVCFSLACGLLCANLSPARGHGAEHALIEAATQAIDADPLRPELWLHRGELHREHRTFKKALADYEQAEMLGADPRLLSLCRAELALDDQRPKAALELLKRIPANQDAQILRMRARARLAMGQDKAATEHLAEALAVDPGSRPHHYLELALARKGLGEIEAGLATLNQGIEKLGSVSSLEFQAVAFEVDLGRFDQALLRIDRLEPQFQRKESLLVRRAAVLRAAGRELEAETAYTEALHCIEALSTKLRKTDLVQQLEQEIHRALTK